MLVRLNLNCENCGDDNTVAHAMDAVVRQEMATATCLVQPVNAIARPMAAPDGEVPVAEAAAVAAGVVPMRHVERAIGKVNASRRRCGTRGCSLPEFHIGLCTGVSIDGKRKRAVAWSEGSDAEEDGDKQADQRTRRRSMSVSQTEGSWCRCYSCLTLYYYKQCRCHVRCLNGGWKCKA